MTIHQIKTEQYLRDNHICTWLATKHHKTHKNKPITFRGREYQKKLYLEESDYIVVKKSTQCFPPGTYIMTPHGIKDIALIKIGDRVLTHKNRGRKVKNIYRSNVENESLLDINTCNGQSITTTKEHPFLAYEFDEKEKYHYTKKNRVFGEDPCWLKASQLYKGDYLLRAKYPTPHVIKHINVFDIIDVKKKGDYVRAYYTKGLLDGNLKLNYDFGRFVGYYLSEGWARIKGHQMGFAFHSDEVEYQAEVMRTLSRITSNSRVTNIISEKDKCSRITISNKTLSLFMKTLFEQKSDGKRIAPIVFRSNPDFIKGVITGLYNGDGYLKGPNAITYKTVSKILANQIVVLLSMFGICAWLSEERLETKKPAYTIGVSGKGVNELNKIIGHPLKKGNKYSYSIDFETYTASRINKYEDVQYSGDLYNLEVEEDNSYVANGYIVHNCGISEWLMCKSFSKALKGRSVFYVLPTFSLTTRFVRNRIDRTCQYSQYYRAIITKGVKSQSESIMLKHFGLGSIAFVGSNTPGVFTEYPADDLIIDELDYCDQDNIQMGWERLSESEHKQEIRISNPTIEGYGIDVEYAETNQYEWFIKGDCGHWILPDFFKHVIRKVDKGRYIIRDENYERGKGDVGLICNKCQKKINRKGGGSWVPKYPLRQKKGYSVSKLFSTNVTITEIVDRFDKGLSNDTIMQRVYNADLGQAYTAPGSKITEKMLDDCKEDYVMRPPDKHAICLIGIDVGKILHIRISQLLPDKRMKAVYIGEDREEKEIVELYKIYNVKLGVIDAGPEMRMSKRIVSKLKNMFMCYFGSVKKDTIDIVNKIITVDRTSALDSVKEAVILQNLILPRNARSIVNYYDHMCASTRTYDEKKERYIWTEGTKDDHFFLAEAYGILARKLLVMLYNRKV